MLSSSRSCIFVFLYFSISSCESFLEIPPPNSKIPGELVFEDNGLATSAIVGIYSQLYLTSSFAGGGTKSIVSLAGLSADELRNNKADPVYLEFQNNDIDPASLTIQALWASMYKGIHQANLAIEGLQRSVNVSSTVKSQLMGEALFLRAFCYFYLVNYFGDVPLALTSDYKINSRLSRSPADEVYDQIENDLLEAANLLNEDYPSSERVRVNKFSANALLARLYLYTGDWDRAEDKATLVISKNLYELPKNLNTVFLSNSKEAIWQLRPADNAYFANEGSTFSVFNAPQYNVLQDDISTAFEHGDSRLDHWILTINSGQDTMHLPYKYKKYTSEGQTNEFSMVIRLAEMYLIRAEARLNRDALALAISDINKIRDRAGLALISNSDPEVTEEYVALAIEQERRVEFLAEWGHRWLDLKRWGKVQAILLPGKPGFTDNDLLYPIPAQEIRNNPNLKPQNPGY